MKTKFFVAAFLFTCCASVFAETFPIIDVQYGYLIGGVENGKWAESGAATKSVKKAAKLQVYGVAGVVGSAAIVKLDTQNEPCEDRPAVKLNPRKIKDGAIAFGAVSQTASPASPSRGGARSTSRRVISPEIAKWNPLPRKPKLLDPASAEATAGKLVGEFLREHGLKDPVIHITQAVQIDLDGDGQDEVVISATHYKNGDEIPDEATPNTYSFVMVARLSQGKNELVAGEFYPEPKPDAAPPNKFEIAAVLDLNGDGKIDIVVRSRYYEGDEISVYEQTASGFKQALSVGCGL